MQTILQPNETALSDHAMKIPSLINNYLYSIFSQEKFIRKK